MSANYNTSLLRQLQAPLLAALRQMEEAVGKVATGQLAPREIDVGKQAHELASGLGMIGRQAVARLAEAISRGVKALSTPATQGWDAERTQAVAQALHALIRAFHAHLQDMISAEAELHVRLWPLWADMARAMEAQPPAVEDLFEIDPDFEDIAFTPRPLAYLQEVVPPAYERLVAAISLVEVARTQQDMERGIHKALEVFTQLYGLRHRRAYQTYWLIVRARLSAGLLLPGQLLADRQQWLSFLRDAGIQIRKFGEDHRRLSQEKLRSALIPLLEPWPAEWTVAHPVLAELDRRLGLSVFWQAVAEIRQETSAGASAQFSLRQKELEALARQVHGAWNKAVSAIAEHRRPAVAGFLQALGGLLDKRDWFPGAMAIPLFDAFRQLGDDLAVRLKEKDMGPVQSFVQMEAAAAILVVEEIIQRRARWSREFEDRIAVQARRLVLATGGRQADLQALPALRWDKRWREKQVDRAIRQAMGQALVHADAIEKSLADLFRGEDEDEIRARFDEFQDRCRIMNRVLLTLRQPLAARLAQGLEEQLAGLAARKSTASVQANPREAELLATVLASLSRFLHASRNADVDADNLLAPGFDALWGKDAYLQALAEASPEMEPEPASSIPDAPAPAAMPAHSHVVDPDSTPPRDLRAQLLGSGTWDDPGNASILPVFLEEADEALTEIALLRSVLREDPRNEDAWASLRRQFHTLKGSGRIAGLMALGEVAWWVEERLNESLVANEFYGAKLDQAIGLAADRIGLWRAQLARQEQGLAQAADIHQALAQALVETTSATPATAPTPTPPPAMSESEISQAWEPAPAKQAMACLPGMDASLSAAVRADALSRADDLASVLIRFEMEGVWDWTRLHLAAHTLAALLQQSGHDPSSPHLRTSRALEEASLSQMETASPAEPAGGLIQATDWLRQVAAFLGEEKAPPSPFQQAWLDQMEGEAASVAEALGVGLATSPPIPEETVETEGALAAPFEADATAEALPDAQEADEWDLRLLETDTPVQTLEQDPAAAPYQPPVLPEAAPLEDPSSLPPPEADLVEAAPLEAPLPPPEADLVEAASLEAPLPPPEADLVGGLPPAQKASLEAPAPDAPVIFSPPAPAAHPVEQTPSPSEPVSARDEAWDRVFQAIDQVQAAFSQLSRALIDLNDQDYRD